MEVAELITVLQEYAPDLTLESGVNFFSFHPELHSCAKIGLCIDPTESNIVAAVNQGVEILISYHPWYHEAEALVSSKNIQLLSLHTTWDNIPAGINFTLAKAIGLKEPNLTGTLVHGELGLTFRELLERTQRALDLNVIPYFGELRMPAHKIGIWAGPGFLPFNREIWETCSREGCDTILSGEFTVSALRYAALYRLKLIDLGHSAAAKPGMAHLAYLLRRRLQDVCPVEFFHDYYGCNYNTSWFFPDRGEVDESLPLFIAPTE